MRPEVRMRACPCQTTGTTEETECGLVWEPVRLQILHREDQALPSEHVPHQEVKPMEELLMVPWWHAPLFFLRRGMRGRSQHRGAERGGGVAGLHRFKQETPHAQMLPQHLLDRLLVRH